MGADSGCVSLFPSPFGNERLMKEVNQSSGQEQTRVDVPVAHLCGKAGCGNRNGCMKKRENTYSFIPFSRVFGADVALVTGYKITFADSHHPLPLRCRFRPSASPETRKIFHSANVDTSTSAPPVIAYCNGGVASTVVLFLLYQLHQRERSSSSTVVFDESGRCDRASWANYDGSWNEWGNDEANPVHASLV